MGLGVGRCTFREAFVPLIPRPMTSPSCTKTQPTGVSSVARASSAISMALRMKPSWYARLGTGPKTPDVVVDILFLLLSFPHCGSKVFGLSFGLVGISWALSVYSSRLEVMERKKIQDTIMFRKVRLIAITPDR